MQLPRSLHLLRIAFLCAALGTVSGAQAQGSQVYRCPGPPVLYTDSLSAKEAQEKGCRSIDGTPVTVVQSVRPKVAAAAAAPASARTGTEGKIDPAQQRARDSDRRQVLERELREAEERLAELQKEYANGQPERKGDERNYQKYIDRVAEMKAGISRQESDIQAIKREIAKLP